MAIEGYDLVMLGILAATAVLGYFKGIVWQIAWIAGIAASGYVALRFGGPLAPFFGQQQPWNRLIAMLALYVGTSLVVWLVFRIISGAINAIHLGAFDHQLGLVFGLAKGVLLCVVVTFFAVTLAPGYREQIVASKSGRIVAELIVRADEYLPKEVVATVDPFVKQFEGQFRDSNGLPTVGQGAGIAGTPSPLQAIWEGITSASAWTGAEQGGAAPAQQGGVVPAGAFWSGAEQPPFSPPPAPARPAASGFSAPAFTPPPQPQPPQRFPVGAQSALPIR